MKKFCLALTLLALPAASLTAVAVHPSYAAAQASKLGNLTAMREIVADTLS